MKLNSFIVSLCLPLLFFSWSSSLRGDDTALFHDEWALQEKETGHLIYRRHPQKEWEAFFHTTEGVIVSRSFYLYNSQGKIEKIVFDNGCCDDPDDLEGVQERHVIAVEVYLDGPLKGKPLKIEHSCLHLPSSSEERLATYHFIYNEEGMLVCIQNDEGQRLENGDSIYQTLQERPVKAYADEFERSSFLSRIWELIESFSKWDWYSSVQRDQEEPEIESSDWLNYLAENTEWFLKGLLGPDVYLMMGAESFETEVDVYGQGEISDRVRVTYINGMFNYPETILESLQVITKFHGGVNVHYVYRPSEGWVWDFSHAFAIKTGFLLGFRSSHVYLLAALWKKLIEEMGGVDGGGIIVHYAHSLGGTETHRARDLLSPEEQKMIRVVTFGSATLIPEGGFQSVMNIVSGKDGVSYNVFIDPLGSTRQMLRSTDEVNIHSSLLSSWPWPFDHALAGPTYSEALKDLGQKFLEEFGEPGSD